MIDDHSEDKTVEIVKERLFICKTYTIKNDGINSYKKKAIETGIAAAKGEWIVTTDAVPAL